MGDGAENRATSCVTAFGLQDAEGESALGAEGVELAAGSAAVPGAGLLKLVMESGSTGAVTKHSAASSGAGGPGSAGTVGAAPAGVGVDGAAAGFIADGDVGGAGAEEAP
jgi:hypothetical protein